MATTMLHGDGQRDEREPAVRHGGVIAWEVVLAVLVLTLAVVVTGHPPPLLSSTIDHEPTPEEGMGAPWHRS